MKKNLEVILDTNPNGGCGCNCGCEGSTMIEDMNKLITEIKEYEFKSALDVDVLPISNMSTGELIGKINKLLSNTNAAFRVDESNIDETLSNLLPLITYEGEILTAYGVPTLFDVVGEVEKVM